MTTTMMVGNEDHNAITNSGGRKNVLLDSKLETGDILVFQGDGVTSHIIEYACDSPWSHVGMILKVTKPFIAEFKTFFNQNKTRQYHNGGNCDPPTPDEFLNMIYSNPGFYAALTREIKIATKERKYKLKKGYAGEKEQEEEEAENSRITYLWESTENDTDPCQITGKTTVGVKLTEFEIRALGYPGIIGRRKLHTPAKRRRRRPDPLTHGSPLYKLNDTAIYIGLLYTMYCNLGKDYEKTYWDLVICWLYDFKYRYGSCEPSPKWCYQSHSFISCRDTIFPSCCYDDYHYVSEYRRFFCAELVSLTMLKVFQVHAILLNNSSISPNPSGIVNHEPHVTLRDGENNEVLLSHTLSQRTIVSIEFLMTSHTFNTYSIDQLVIYNHLSFRHQ